MFIASIFSKFSFKTKFKIFKGLLTCSEYFGGSFEQTAIPARFFNQFKEYPFYDDKMIVPKKSEELLSFIYGNEWRTPMEKWSFYDTKNKKNTSIVFINRKFDYVSAIRGK